MMYVFFGKFSKVMLNHNPNLIAEVLIGDVKRQRVKMIMKSMVLKDFSKIELSDSNGDGFAQNLITARITCNCYKIPRFLKKSLLKKFKPL